MSKRSARERKQRRQTNLLEADELRLFSEASTTQVDGILADQTVSVVADTAECTSSNEAIPTVRMRVTRSPTQLNTHNARKKANQLTNSKKKIHTKLETPCRTS